MDTLWLHITSGSGPEECARAAALTRGEILKEAAARNIRANVLAEEPSGVKGNFRSVLLGIEGEGAESFARSWTGVIKWIWRSGYRPGHKRKNWFTGVACYTQCADESVFDIRDVEIKTTRASGPGGQHVNKTESAVRAVHIPSGKSVRAQEERSQAMNKKLALARLAALLAEEAAAKLRGQGAALRLRHYSLERGNPLRVYSASPVKLLQRNIN